MASIWRHPRSPYWTACFRDEQGRQRRRSTKTTDRRLARRIAEEYEKAIRGKRTLHQLEKVLRAYHEELCGQSVENRSLRVFCTEWLAEKEQSVALSTIKFYRGVVTKLFTYFGSRADEVIGAITRADLVAFRAELAKHVSVATANHDMIGVRALFAAARSAGRLAEDPSEFIKPMRIEADETPRRPFTIPELQAVLAAADPEWQSMIRIGLYSGARLGDVASLRWSDVDFDRSELRFIARKTRARVLVPIAGPLRNHLMDLAGSDDAGSHLHPRAAEILKRNKSSASLSAQFGLLLESAGLRPVKSRGCRTPGTRRNRLEPLSYHSLRHTIVSMLKDSGTPQAVVQELVGHASADVNALYTHVGKESLEKATASLPLL
jgi:integrase